jgi:primosomal protein N'
MSANDYEDSLACRRCNDPRPPGPELCPRCEDLQAARLAPGNPEPVMHRNPPHGNTTR